MRPFVLSDGSSTLRGEQERPQSAHMQHALSPLLTWSEPLWSHPCQPWSSAVPSSLSLPSTPSLGGGAGNSQLVARASRASKQLNYQVEKSYGMDGVMANAFVVEAARPKSTLDRVWGRVWMCTPLSAFHLPLTCINVAIKHTGRQERLAGRQEEAAAEACRQMAAMQPPGVSHAGLSMDSMGFVNACCYAGRCRPDQRGLICPALDPSRCMTCGPGEGRSLLLQ
jgi:hypothetical protein